MFKDIFLLEDYNFYYLWDFIKKSRIKKKVILKELTKLVNILNNIPNNPPIKKKFYKYKKFTLMVYLDFYKKEYITHMV